MKPVQPELPSIDVILYNLTNDGTDPKKLSQEELEAYRLSLAAIKKAVGAKMAETSTKEHIYDDDEVKDYIDAILEDGYNLNETELSDYPEFIDAQKLKRWDTLIAERVEASKFGAKVFKIHQLRLLRSNIAKSRTLHELRMSVNLMISPLQLWNDHCVLVQRTSKKQVAQDNKEVDAFIDSILIENEELKKESAERKRIIDCMLSCYEECDSDIQLLRNIEGAKKEHGLSDTDAAKVFGVSRKKLLSLRENIKLSDGITPVFGVKKEEATAPVVDNVVVPDANDFTAFPDRLDDLGF